MVGLSHNLIKRCRTTLLRCGHFDNHVKLQAIFVVDELAYLRPSLPEVSAKSDRVDATIDYLLSRISRDGRPALTIFLIVLRDRYEGDELYGELDALRSEVERELSKVETVEVPFVIGAMTQEEAMALFNETVFDDPSVAPMEHEKFRAFSQSLHEHSTRDISSNYGERREEWRPHTYSEQPIENIVYGIVDRINELRRELPSLPLIQPQFLSPDFFGDDIAKRRRAWGELGKSGGIMIVDAVSLFHPSVRQKLSQSAVSSNPQVALLILSPINTVTMRVNQLIEELISSQMELAFSRFDLQLDKLCEIGVGDLRTLQRWLFAVLPDEVDIVRHQKPNPMNRQILREKMGRGPLGVERAIFG